jgi:hypothetical protein
VAETTTKRSGELIRKLFGILMRNPDGESRTTTQSRGARADQASYSDATKPSAKGSVE